MALRDWFRPPPQLTPVTAAVVSSATTLDTNEVRRETRENAEAWRVWRCLGEIHYATTQQARLVGRLEWRVTIDGKELETEVAQETMRAAFGKRLRDLQVSAALHLQVAGGYILARADDIWQVLPISPDHKAKKILDRATVVVTVETPDPKDPQRLDSPVYAALDVARELILARAQSRAAARSRTAQLNTLIYPLEGAGPDTKMFEKKLMDVMVAPLSDERSTASVVPNLIGFPNEYIANWKTLDLTGPIDEKLHDRIERLIRQLALQLDIPPELLLGMADVNHWTGWLMQEDNWLGHVEPLASSVGQGFAEALARFTETESEIEVEADPAALLKRRPTIADVQAAWESGLVSDEWAREQIGAPPDAVGPGRAQPANESVEVVEGESTEEPDEPLVAAAGLPVDPVRLTEIDLHAFEAATDLVTDTATRALERVGARLRSAAQGQKIELPADKTNLEIAIAFTGVVENFDRILEEQALAAVDRVERIVARAFRHARMAGVAMDLDEVDLKSAQDLFVAQVAEVARVIFDGAAGVAEAWTAGRRVIAVAGGNSDPAAMTAAAGTASTPRGVALGVRAMDLLSRDYDLIAETWTWYHAYAGPRPHPEHQMLHGRTIRPGGTILESGVNWYPGDHTGCRCLATPVLTPRSSQ